MRQSLAEARAAPGAGVPTLVRLIAKHHAAALVATAVDYVVMVACVRGIGCSPPLAAAVGPFVGAIVGFTLSRRWVYRATHAAMRAQAVRYLSVSLLSLVGNAGGEALLVRAGWHYVTARAIVSLVVALGWNFPMQCYFVFDSTLATPSSARGRSESEERSAA